MSIFDIRTERKWKTANPLPRPGRSRYSGSGMVRPPSHWHTTGLPLLLERRDLPDDLVAAAITDLTAGQFDEAEATSLLIALRMKGESASELAAAVRVLRGVMHKLDCPSRPVLDTC